MTLILVTGATGEVARGVLPELRKRFDLRLLAIDAPENNTDFVRADLLDWHALQRATAGVDVVLHLAVASGHSGTYENDRFNDVRFDVNVKGTYHVFECARRARVRRVVHVSSLMAVWGEAFDAKDENPVGDLRSDGPPKPVGTYALTKALGEQIAEYYASARPGDPVSFPHEVVTLRIAAPLDLDDPELRTKKLRPQQVPFPDLAHAFIQALTVPLERYEVVTIVGECSRRTWDLEPARRVLRYTPRYNLDDLGLPFAPAFDVSPE